MFPNLLTPYCVSDKEVDNLTKKTIQNYNDKERRLVKNGNCKVFLYLTKEIIALNLKNANRKYKNFIENKNSK